MVSPLSRVRRGLLLAAGLGVAALVAGGQERGDLDRGPDGGTHNRVAGIEVLPIAGRPFVGKDVIEWTRTLADGSTMTTHLYAVVARDSLGRVYRERRDFVPANGTADPARREIILYDPGLKTKTVCVLAERRCTITSFRPILSYSPPPPGASSHGTVAMVRESLGSEVIDGLSVTGTRETVTVAAGAAGNQRPLVTTKEFWYSPDLETNLAVTRNDPKEGVQDIHLGDVTRSEPAAEMFEPPAGFAMHDLRSETEAKN